MENMENLIYIKHNSITSDLCKDIIKIFENKGNNTRCVPMKNAINTADDSSSQLQVTPHKDVDSDLHQYKNSLKPQNIRYDSQYERIKNCLLYELKRNVNKFTKIVESFNNHITQNNDGVEFSLLKIKDLEPNFIIKKVSNTNFEHIINDQTDFNNVNKLSSSDNCDISFSRKLKYIWFLNDCCGKFSVGNNTITTCQGTLLIYPVSWLFPCYETFILNETKYYIYGYLSLS